jgi:hypothetical protein
MTAALSPGKINVDARSFHLDALSLGLTITTPCSASRVYAPIHNLSTYYQILIIDQDLEQICPLGQISFPFELWELLAQKLDDLAFDQVNPMLFLAPCILAQSTKIWRHCIIAFLYCTIPYASSHKHQLTSALLTMSKSASIWCNLEYILCNLVVIQWFLWPLMDCYHL